MGISPLFALLSSALLMNLFKVVSLEEDFITAAAEESDERSTRLREGKRRLNKMKICIVRQLALIFLDPVSTCCFLYIF